MTRIPAFHHSFQRESLLGMQAIKTTKREEEKVGVEVEDEKRYKKQQHTTLHLLRSPTAPPEFLQHPFVQRSNHRSDRAALAYDSHIDRSDPSPSDAALRRMWARGADGLQDERPEVRDGL